MKKFLALLAMLAWAGVAHAQAQVLQAVQFSNGQNGATKTIPLNITPKSANSVLVVGVESTCTAAPTLADTGNHSWVLDKNFAGQGGGVAVFHAVNASQNFAAITATLVGGGCSYQAIFGVEVTGITGALDGAPVSNTFGGVNTTTFNIGTLQTSNANDFLVAVARDNYGIGLYSPQTGWSFLNATNSPAALEDFVSGAAGAYPVSLKMVQPFYIVAGVALAYSSGGGGTNPLPPVVTLGPPIVSGSFTLTANVSDNVPVTQVQYFLDGTVLGTVTAAPWNFTWNTTTASNASHVVSAVATNNAGQTGNSGNATYIVNNSAAQQASGSGSLQVAGTVPPLVIDANFTMPQGTVGTAYSQNVGTVAHVSGGVTPYTYALSGGALPTGLTLSTAGVISGTPTAAGTSNFTVTVTDSSGHAAVLDLSVRTEVGQ
jgi:hypothetical protein